MRPSRQTMIDVVALWRAEPGALIVFGKSSGPIPKAGSARGIGAAGGFGVFRAEVWQGSDQVFLFAAAIRLADLADPGEDGHISIRGSRSDDQDLSIRLCPACSESELGSHLGGAADRHAAQLLQFLLHVMQDQVLRGLLAAFLARAAKPDGCIELILALPEKCVAVQGWGSARPNDKFIVVSETDFMQCSSSLAVFARADIQAPAAGLLAVLPTMSASEIQSAGTVYILSGDNLLVRPVVGGPVLDNEASRGHIRHLLPRLEAPVAILDLLRAYAAPLFTGRDTLAESGKPVRAAIDFGVSLPGAGTYISGWILDPSAHLAQVHLCWDKSQLRLDDQWTGVERSDVCTAFSTDSAFVVPDSYLPGFVVSTQVWIPNDTQAYLKFFFRDASVAFMPVRLATDDTPTIRRALVASVDRHKRSYRAVLEQQLAPFNARLPGVVPQISVAFGSLKRTQRRALVVPLTTSQLPRGLIGLLLQESLNPDEQIVLLSGPDWDNDQYDALIQIIELYDLPVLLLTSTVLPDALSALRAAVQFTSADEFLIMSTGVLGGSDAWRESLSEASASKYVVCPTILFEDHSLQFGGDRKLSFSARPPYIAVSSPTAGLPIEALAIEGLTQEIKFGSLSCCLIPRSAALELHRSETISTPLAREMDVFLTFSRAGIKVVWQSSTIMSAAEENALQPMHTQQDLDCWAAQRKWHEVTQCAS